MIVYHKYDFTIIILTKILKILKKFYHTSMRLNYHNFQYQYVFIKCFSIVA